MFILVVRMLVVHGQMRTIDVHVSIRIFLDDRYLFILSKYGCVIKY